MNLIHHKRRKGGGRQYWQSVENKVEAVVAP